MIRLLFPLVILFLIGCGGESSDTSVDTSEFETNTTSPTSNDKSAFEALTQTFNVGYGSRYAYFFTNEKESSPSVAMSSVDLLMNEAIGSVNAYQSIKNFNATAFETLQKYLTKSKYTIYWITKGWEESWFNLSRIQKSVDAGYVPVIVYWYFGDELRHGLSINDLESYAIDNERLGTFLKKINGMKLLIMEPEFNKNHIIDNASSRNQFIEAMRSAIDTIKQEDNSTYFSLSMTDTGSRNSNRDCGDGFASCALADIEQWSQTEPIYEALADKLDFISFHQMLGAFSRNPTDSDNPIAYTRTQLGIDYFAERIFNLTTYLNETYQKPVFLPYIGIATATWSDNNNNGAIENEELDLEGWEDVATSIYAQLAQKQEALLGAGLFGYAPMSLFDNPQHDEGGYQYFLNNEYHLGIFKTGAIDSVDNYPHGDIVLKGSDNAILSSIFGEL